SVASDGGPEDTSVSDVGGPDTAQPDAGTEDTVAEDDANLADTEEPDAGGEDVPTVNGSLPDAGEAPDTLPADAGEPEDALDDVQPVDATLEDTSGVDTDTGPEPLECVEEAPGTGPCELAVCTDGTWGITLLSGGLDCDDGDPCTEDEACVDGACVGTPMVCSDGDPCTHDTCQPLSGCVYESMGCEASSATWDFALASEYEFGALAEVANGATRLSPGPPQPLEGSISLEDSGLLALWHLDTPRPDDAAVVTGVLSAWWRFEEDSWTGAGGEIVDGVGEHHGTAEGGTPGPGGLHGQAASLSLGDSLVLDRAGLANGGSFTAAAWAKVDQDSASGHRPVMSRWHRSDAFDTSLFSTFDAGSPAPVGPGTTGYFGGVFDVVHHSTLIEQLIAQGRVTPQSTPN
ncbi:MAG: hypothetical protein QF464_21550, partial [Myxococcota bacterium]|nr:hypothetical protein [Myxococcota bacterium]